MGFNKMEKGARSCDASSCMVTQTAQALDFLHRPGHVHDYNRARSFILAGIRSVREAVPLAENANRIAEDANAIASVANDIASEALQVSKRKQTFVVAAISAVCAFASAIFAALAYLKSP